MCEHESRLAYFYGLSRGILSFSDNASDMASVTNVLCSHSQHAV
jgi:hypothetical protein